MKKLLFLATAAAVVLSSCSKDTTEVVAPAQKGGNVVFSASLNVENDDTRLHIDKKENGNWGYVWDKGDAIGIHSSMNGAANVPSYAVEESVGTTTNFAVSDDDVRFFGNEWNGGALYVYYPYVANNAMTADGIQLTIPATQRYAENSIYKMTAPAIGYVESYDMENKPNVELTIPASIIRVPITGLGKVNELTMKLWDGTQYVNLAGSVYVDPTAETYEMPVTGMTTDAITIDCGTGVDLKYLEATNFFFIVPNVSVTKDSYFEFYFNGETDPLNAVQYTFETLEVGATKTMKPNKVTALETKPIVYGLDGKVLIQDVYDLIAYAYGNREGFNNTKEAYLISEGEAAYNFNTYNEGVEAEYDALRAYAGTADLTPEQLAAAEAKMAILKWYLDNGCGIEPLDSGAIVGGNQAAATITGLKVNDDFAFKTGFTISNVTLKGLSTNKRVLYGASATTCVGENVTIDTPSVDYVTSAISSKAVNELATTKHFSIVGENVVYANKLQVDHNITITDKFNAIDAVADKTAVVTAAAELKDEVLAAVEAGTPIAANGYYSVIIDGTSYWTGEVATSEIVDDYFTAEELALAVVKRGSATLKGVNIDLQNKNWTPVLNDAGNGYLTVTGEVDAEDNVLYSISNVNIEVVKDGEIVVESTSGTNGYALFGLKANMYDLVVEDLTINLDNLTNETYIGGLACRTKGVDNVTVNGGTVNIGKNITTNNAEKYQCFGVVAGKIANTVLSVNNCTVNGVSLQSMDKDTFDYGMVFGAFELKNGKDVVFENISTDKKASLIGLAYVNVPDAGVADAPEITLTNCTAAEGTKTVIRRIEWSNTTQNYYIEINNTPFNHTKTSY